MIRANCRARFTAADFDFVVRALARSQTDQVSLVDLLSDVETRDSILDHPRLVEAILSNCGHLRISSQFYLCSGPARFAARRDRRPRLRTARRYSLTHANFTALAPEIWSGELWR
jgi:hypothetical protein